MTDRSSNGEYNMYQLEDDGRGDEANTERSINENKPRIPLEKDREEKDYHSDKAGEYMRELLAEKLAIDPQKWPNAMRLIDQEIQKTQAIGKPLRDPKYVDIYREKPIRVAVKVLVPVREHPKFNFVGKLLGPKGNSMKRLQEETMCKMAVLGRGSMKDRQKEEDFRQSLDPKYAHLTDDLHVEIASLAPPAEAHARICVALEEVRKYLIPDNNDTIRQAQMREIELGMVNDPTSTEDRQPSIRSARIQKPITRPPQNRTSREIQAPLSTREHFTRTSSAKAKVLSILDRARVTMEQNYGFCDSVPPSSSRSSHYDYDYRRLSREPSSNSSRYAERHFSPSTSDDIHLSTRYTAYDCDDDPSHHSSHTYFEAPHYSEESSGRAWKSYKSTSTSSISTRYRSVPYSRPTK